MDFSVLIPTYLNGQTIVATIESVLAQRHRPREILVLLDGIADDTPQRLAPYRDHLTLITQANRGVAQARNRLVAEARGHVLAFLDADDLWHPDYLQAQADALAANAHAVASYSGHHEFTDRVPAWSEMGAMRPVEHLTPRTFFQRLNTTSAEFGSMSYCCVRRSIMARLGPEPFSGDLCGPEDCYLHYQLALQGPVTFQPAPRVAYRLRQGSLSDDRVRVLRDWTRVFDRLEDAFARDRDPGLRGDFRRFQAQKRREYAQVLLGVGAIEPAREELRQSRRDCRSPLSLAKSTALLALSHLPRLLQPRWPEAVRKVPPPREAGALSTPIIFSR